MVTTEVEMEYYEDALLNECELDLSSSIGVWKDDYNKVYFHLIKEDSSYSIVMEFDDGSYHRKALNIKPVTDSHVFTYCESSDGDYFLLNHEVLEYWDQRGCIDTYQSVS